MVKLTIKENMIIIPLLSIILLTIISLLSGNNFISSAVNESYNFQLSINSSISNIGIDNTDINLGLDPLISAVIWIGIISAIAVASSIAVLGSGLNSGGSRWLVGGIAFTSVWIMFSTYPFPIIIDFGTIGIITYFVLTLIYAIGGIWYLIGSD